jgi:hypothetical protein
LTPSLRQRFTEVLNETRAALEELQTASQLAGKAGRAIAARSCFRGRTRDGDVNEYVDFILGETDMRLGVYDWIGTAARLLAGPIIALGQTTAVRRSIRLLSGQRGAPGDRTVAAAEAAAGAVLRKRAVDAGTVLDRSQIRMPVFSGNALRRAGR